MFTVIINQTRADYVSLLFIFLVTNVFPYLSDSVFFFNNLCMLFRCMADNVDKISLRKRKLILICSNLNEWVILLTTPSDN